MYNILVKHFQSALHKDIQSTLDMTIIKIVEACVLPKNPLYLTTHGDTPIAG